MDLLSWLKKRLPWILAIISTSILILERINFWAVFSFLRDHAPTWSTSWTDWLQASTWLFSAIAAFSALYISRAFNHNSEVQTKMSFESNRPKVQFQIDEFDPGRRKTAIRNEGASEADNVILYTLFYSQGDSNLKIRKQDLHISMAEGQQEIVKINENWGEKQSNLLIYTNRMSGVVYVKGYNLDTQKTGSYAPIWEKFEDWTPSPLSKEGYLTISRNFSVVSQILESKKPLTIYSELDALIASLFESASQGNPSK